MAQGDVTISVAHGGAEPSFIDLPVVSAAAARWCAGMNADMNMPIERLKVDGVSLENGNGWARGPASVAPTIVHAA